MKLKRFWIRFKPTRQYDGLRPGCCVTGYEYDDPMAILKDTVFRDQESPPVESVIEDVDVSTLDQKHVVPNMEPVVWRGVWFPKGFSFLR